MSLLKKLSEKNDLSSEEASQLAESIINGTMSPLQAGAALTALKMKGETIDEIFGFAKVLREHAIKIRPAGKHLVDTCGTGGDGSHTFNISTASAFIAAGAGATVAKHGNRSVSGKCGSVDVLEQLGVRMMQPEAVEDCINKIGIGFMFAPFFNPVMAKAAPIRKELGIRTVFNVMGPLLSPANCSAQLVGVFSPEMAGPVAKVLLSLGTERAIVVNSNGMDEIGLGKTKVSEVNAKKVMNYEIDSNDFGFGPEKIPVVASAKESGEIILDLLNGKAGPARNVCVLNAGAAIYVSGIADSMKEGVKLAQNSIDSGKAMEKLEQVKNFCREVET